MIDNNCHTCMGHSTIPEIAYDDNSRVFLLYYVNKTTASTTQISKYENIHLISNHNVRIFVNCSRILRLWRTQKKNTKGANPKIKKRLSWKSRCKIKQNLSGTSSQNRIWHHKVCLSHKKKGI